MKTSKRFLLTGLVFFLILAVSVLPAVQGQVLSQIDGLEHTQFVEGSIPLLDCPEMVDKSKPYRLVLQIINNTFYKWREYDMGNQREFYIFMEEPEYRGLTAGEARNLLIASQGWMHQIQSSLIIENESGLAPRDLPSQSLMPHIDEPRPYIVGDYIFHEPDTSISRTDCPASCNFILSIIRSISQSEILVTPQTVFGTDDRERVAYEPCKNYPWNTIGFVLSDFGYSGSYRGTGFLISQYAGLTNAHNLYSSSMGGWYEELIFSPGQYQEYQGSSVYFPFGDRNAFNAEIPTLYIEYEEDLNLNNPYDYGAFFIETPFAGISTFMPIEFDFYPYYINLAGYPIVVRGETDSYAMWHSFGEVVGVWERELDYLADVSSGNSGGPVWVYDSNTNISRVVGLVAKSAPSYNTGPRLTHHNKALIEEWMHWRPESAIIPVDSVVLNKNSINLREGSSETLIATVHPADATNKNLIWSSSDSNVATVNSNGVVTAVANGTASIVVRTEDGNKTDTCTVNVSSPFESLNATVESFKFFESGDYSIPYGQREYNSSFHKSSTRFVNYELNIDHSAPGEMVYLELRAEYRNPDGSLFDEFSSTYEIESDWIGSSLSHGLGWSETGYWPAGTYTVRIFDGSRQITSGSFTIIDEYVLSDIEGHRYQESIQKMVDLGVLAGRGDGKFYPEDTLIRAEAAKVAAMLMGFTEADAQAAVDNNIFKDVYKSMPAHGWARGWINLIAAEGIILGDGTGNYSPGGPLLMTEWGTILLRVLLYSTEGLAWPDEYDEKILQLGLDFDIDYIGLEPVTRAEMARFSETAVFDVTRSDGKTLKELFF